MSSLSGSTEADPDGQTRDSGVRSLWELRTVVPSRLTLVVVSLMSLVGGVLEALLVALVASVAATVAQGGDGLEASLGPFEITMATEQSLLVGFGATVVMVTMRLLAGGIGSRLAARTLVETRTSLLRAYLHAHYERQRELLSAEFHDLLVFQAMRSSQAVLMAVKALTAVFSFLALVGVAVLVDPPTAGVLLGASLVLAALFLPLVRRSHRAGGEHLDAQVQVGVELDDVTGLLAETHVYGAQQGMLERAADALGRAGRAFRTAAFITQATPALYLGVVMTLLLVGLFALDVVGVANLQTVGAIVLLTLRGLKYSQQAQSTVQTAVELAPDVESVTRRLREYRASAISDEGDELDRIDELEFEGVAYVYPGSDEGVEDVSTVLRRGEVVGVVGHSGAGKTTFAELVLGLRDPTRGQVLVNGVPRSVFRPRSWYDRVAYVGQESLLLVGSVSANVAFFRPVGEHAVARALAEASLTDDLARWEHGDRREVGSGGRDVSGGQRQRIAIARALAGRPDVIVMDEPTSALDPTSEQQIRETIAALAGEVLVIVVAHRVSTLQVCGRILQFEEGHMTEVTRGERDTLLVE